jgi:hypothetical protein
MCLPCLLAVQAQEGLVVVRLAIITVVLSLSKHALKGSARLTCALRQAQGYGPKNGKTV